MQLLVFFCAASAQCFTVKLLPCLKDGFIQALLIIIFVLTSKSRKTI